ncbi:hypothetical protein NP233_g12184 [Leucocoprinus birnbaumii]|uniref:Uncharacterized protein n=1 Tax=Leucocoprinus birnbaumii TaxID=56174 RepID=A0AAD5VGR8_9AGAR|nr:hypothetical protein NP233_g12184 [Leucocoprinus birnbaumii]
MELRDHHSFVLRYILDAVSHVDLANPETSSEALASSIEKLAKLPETHRGTWYRQQAINDWAAATSTWISNAGQLCQDYKNLAGNHSPPEMLERTNIDSDIIYTALEDLTRETYVLRHHALSLQRIRNGLKARIKIMKARQADMIAKARDPDFVLLFSEGSVEDGEIREDVPVLHGQNLANEGELEDGEIREEVHSPDQQSWDDVTQTRAYISTLASEASHRAHLDAFEKLECEVFKKQSAPMKLNIRLEELKAIVGSTAQAVVSREAERTLIEVEDNLLRFKAADYDRLLLKLQEIDRLVTGVKSELSKIMWK